MAILIDPKNAFVHVVYDYRCLVRAEYGYEKGSADKLVSGRIPEITTIARNAVLSKARSLVDFYLPTTPYKRTDIIFTEYFSGSIDSALRTRLEDIKYAMEVHDIHLTAWRDPVYRGGQSDSRRQRIEWNTGQTKIVSDLVDALRQVSSTLDSRWVKAFMRLHETCVGILRNGGDWDSELNQENIISYLTGLGL